MCEPSMSARSLPPGRRPKRLPSGSRRVWRPASRIQPSTSSRASSSAGVAKRRVIRPCSSLQRARTSQRSSTVRVSDMGCAPRERRLELLRAHPELAGREAEAGELTEASAREQQAARLDRLAADELAALTTLNADYGARFGFPFIACVGEHSVESLLAWGRARLAREPDAEIATALAEVGKIVGLRLRGLVAARCAPSRRTC